MSTLGGSGVCTKKCSNEICAIFVSPCYVYLSLLACPCVHKFVSKAISESSQPPGGSLINLVASLAARKHNTELQPSSVQSSIAH